MNTATESYDDTIPQLHVSLDGFEGPLDLLLSLAKSHKVDLKKLQLGVLADQFLNFLKEIVPVIIPLFLGLAFLSKPVPSTYLIFTFGIIYFSYLAGLFISSILRSAIFRQSLSFLASSKCLLARVLFFLPISAIPNSNHPPPNLFLRSMQD